MYTLYGGKYTRALMVEMLMVEAGIPYDLVEIDIVNNAHRSAEFLALNPAGFIPALEIQKGSVIHETHAINLFLIDCHGLEQLGPQVADPLRGAFFKWAIFYCRRS